MSGSRVRFHSYRAGFVATTVGLVATLVLAPFIIASMITSIRTTSGTPYQIASRPVALGDKTALNIDAVALDPVAGTVSLDLSGIHHCLTDCGKLQRVRFYALRAMPAGSDGAPPSQSIDLTKNATEVDAQIVLPVDGALGAYPFDSYRLDLGIALSYVNRSGNEVPIPSAVAERQLAVSVDEDIGRIEMAPPAGIPVGRFSSTGVPLVVASTLDFTRPLYLQAITVLLVLLIALAAFYAILVREFKDIIGTAGVIVLGVWGVRALLVGNYPADSTGVDVALSLVVLALLVTIAIRGAAYLRERARHHAGAGSGGAEGTGADGCGPAAGGSAAVHGEPPELPEIPDFGEIGARS